MDNEFIWFGVFLLILTALSNVEDWISAWRFPRPQEEDYEHHEHPEDTEEMFELGYKDAQARLGKGITPDSVEIDLWHAWSERYDQGVAAAIQAWVLKEMK